MLTASRPKTHDGDGRDPSAGPARDTHGDPTPVIEFRAVSKRFRIQSERTLTQFLPRLMSKDAWRPPFWAVQDVSFSISRGETVGLIGRNGSGKSTTLKLVAGVMLPTQGEVRVAGRISPLIELGAGFHPDLSGRENIYLNASMLGLTNAEIRQAIPDIVAFSGLEHFMDTPVKRFSSGMYIRLAFSVAVHTRPEILLVDEALSVGDAPFKEKCMARMAQLQEQGVTILFVSHGLDAVRDFCPRVLVMESGHLIFDGAGAEAIEVYSRIAAAVPGEATPPSPEE